MDLDPLGEVLPTADANALAETHAWRKWLTLR